MSSNGISDRVAIIGMGCTEFGERWGKSAEDLCLDAANDALGSASLGMEDIDAFWFGTMASGLSGIPLAEALKIDYKPVTRVENMCATGSEALRNACYAVACGAYDVVMAVGVEKLKDSGFSGLVLTDPPNDGTQPTMTAPACFSLLSRAYTHRYGLTDDEMKSALTHVAGKNHYNGSLNPRAQFRSPVSEQTIRNAPLVAGNLGIYDCSGVSDGAAAAIICRVEDAHRFTSRPLVVKALALSAGPGTGSTDSSYSYTTIPEVVKCAKDAYRQAGVTDPRAEFAMAEVHDCFTPTELVLMEDLGFSDRGASWRDVLAGVFDLKGDLPVNPDGGLKSFGHPIGASGLRMIFECWLQLRGEAGERQIDNGRTLALTHNLGGVPGRAVSFVGVFGAMSSLS